MAFLVVLDQPMIGVAGIGQRIEPQSVDGRTLQQHKIWCCSAQMRQIEMDDVVSQQELGAFDKVLEGLRGFWRESALIVMGVNAFFTIL